MSELKTNSPLKKAQSPRVQTVYSGELVAGLFFNTVPLAMRIFREEMRSHRSGAMSMPQFRILAKLWLEPTSNKELAGYLGVSGAAMTRMVDSLSNEGLVARSTSKIDRRAISIRLTKKGQIYFQKIRGAAILSLAHRLEALDGAILDQLGVGLGLMSKALNELRNSSGVVIALDAPLDR